MSDHKPIPRFPMEGVEVWRNPKNKFVVYQLHYSVDPKKRDPKYREEIRSTMPIAQYLQEYELQWDSFEGTPVYRDYVKATHACRTPLRASPGLPLLRGWDFGLTPACVVAQYVEGQLRVLREYVSFNEGADTFIPRIKAELMMRYTRWSDQKEHWRDYIDPSGFNRSQTDMSQCAQYLREAGMQPFPGPMLWEQRRKAVEHFLTRHAEGRPCFQLDLAECPTLNAGFEGGYRYPEKVSEIEPAKVRPIKDKHSHPHDALQYVCHAVISFRPHRHSNIPRPSYGWSRPSASDLVIPAPTTEEAR